MLVVAPHNPSFTILEEGLLASAFSSPSTAGVALCVYILPDHVSGVPRHREQGAEGQKTWLLLSKTQRRSPDDSETVTGRVSPGSNSYVMH